MNKEQIAERNSKRFDLMFARAEKFVALHNAACKEYKMVFRKFGVQMWHDDDAHAIPSQNCKFIAMRMFEGWRYNITRPLTVLDGQKISDERRKQLDKEIDEIWKRYRKQVGR
ncbi:hypothetical protein L0244_34875 [bacterium]|nr:hypothetical protein [bacterium]